MKPTGWFPLIPIFLWLGRVYEWSALSSHHVSLYDTYTQHFRLNSPKKPPSWSLCVENRLPPKSTYFTLRWPRHRKHLVNVASSSSGLMILFLKKKKKTQNKMWLLTGWLNGEEWILAWFTCHGVPPLVGFPALYYPNGNRIPDKGNDWLLLGLEPSYLIAEPVSKCFTIQSLSPCLSVMRKLELLGLGRAQFMLTAGHGGWCPSGTWTMSESSVSWTRAHTWSLRDGCFLISKYLHVQSES